MRSLATLAFFVFASLSCHAESRWCAVSGPFSPNRIIYPPIAKAARVQGTVVMRIVYSPAGKVLKTEPVFGPVMLSDSLAKQSDTWTLKTNATGEDPCITLLIASFSFNESLEALPPIPPQPPAPGVLRVTVEAEMILLSDPAEDPSHNLFKTTAYRLRRAVAHIFHR